MDGVAWSSLRVEALMDVFELAAVSLEESFFILPPVEEDGDHFLMVVLVRRTLR
jgi:hypothetical protein